MRDSGFDDLGQGPVGIEQAAGQAAAAAGADRTSMTRHPKGRFLLFAVRRRGGATPLPQVRFPPNAVGKADQGSPQSGRPGRHPESGHGPIRLFSVSQAVNRQQDVPLGFREISRFACRSSWKADADSQTARSDDGPGPRRGATHLPRSALRQRIRQLSFHTTRTKSGQIIKITLRFLQSKSRSWSHSTRLLMLFSKQ